MKCRCRNEDLSKPGEECASARRQEKVRTPFLLKLDHALKDETQSIELLLPHSRYDLVNRLYVVGTIEKSKAENDGVHIRATIPSRLYPQFAKILCPARSSNLDWLDQNQLCYHYTTGQSEGRFISLFLISVKIGLPV